MQDTFPRQQARTRRFSLGVPRTFTVTDDGSAVYFLRSADGTDPVTSLWSYDVRSGEERLVVDPTTLGASDGEATPEERARRERRREQAGGIVAYSADAHVSTAVFTLAGELWVVDLASGHASRCDVPGPVFDPRIDPAGGQVAWCRGDELWRAALDGSGARRVAGGEADGIVWGQAEFVAAEEMGRDRGHWWLGEGEGLLVARVDASAVGTWWIADPAHPDRAPAAHRYPAAGTADADVTLWVVGDGGDRTEVVWDRTTHPYVAAVVVASGAPLLVVERRDHRMCRVLEVDPTTGATTTLAVAEDAAWVDWPSGLPARLDDGTLLWAADRDGTTVLLAAGEPVTPAGLQVRAVVGVARTGVVFTASDDPTFVDLYHWGRAGTSKLSGGGVTTAAAVGGSTVVAGRRDLETPATTTMVLDVTGATLGSIEWRGAAPLVTPSVRMLEIGPDRLRTGLVLPAGHTPGTRLPVLMRPYGGPGAQMVLADQQHWLEAQWWADQGFAVVVADGRGSPGRGPAWERRVHLDLASGVLDDQVTALIGAADADADLDLGRVAIAGWSFGGFLSALAVLRRPDVFHAAVAGAPVTDWRLYDTYYTERYLGHPDADPGVYERSSLLADAGRLTRPLLFVHGLVDDNVVVAHTLRLSQRLLEAGCPHAVVPLTGVTHMASQEDVAENLLLLELRFLRDALDGRSR